MSASKSFSNETSERYARALFEVAKDSSEIEQIERSLQDFLTLQNNEILKEKDKINKLDILFKKIDK